MSDDELNQVLAILLQIGDTLSKGDRILRIAQVCELTSLPRAQIYKLEQAGHFPARIALTTQKRSVGWRFSEIQAWIRTRPPVVGGEVAE